MENPKMTQDQWEAEDDTQGQEEIGNAAQDEFKRFIAKLKADVEKAKINAKD